MKSSNLERVLVTGGSGFIGGHLMEALRHEGAEVRNLDIRPPADSVNSAVYAPVDLLDKAAVNAVFQSFQPTHVVNLAANADISQSGSAFAVNTVGLQHLVDAALLLPNSPHILHASTQLVVGPERSAASDREYFPYTEYGETKAESEALLWRAPPEVTWTVVRPTTIWGPRHVSFPKSVWKYIARGWYLLPTGVDPVRAYGYVGNTVHQMLEAARGGRQFDRSVFYVGDEPVQSSKWLDGFSQAMIGRPVRRLPGAALKLAARVGDISGKLGGPSPINTGRLYRMSTNYPVPMAKTFELLGRGPYSFEQGVEATLGWLSSQAGFEALKKGR